VAVVGTATVQVEANLDGVREDIKRQLDEALAALNDSLKVKIKVELDTTGLTTRLDAVARDRTVKVSAETGVADAKLEATKLKAEEAARNRTAKIDVDKKEAEEGLIDLGFVLDKLGLQADAFGNMTTAKIGLIAAGVEAAVAAVGEAFAVLPALAGGATVAIGTIALGIDGIKAAAQSIAPEFDNLRQSISNTFERGLTPVFDNLATVLFPALKSGLNDVAQSLVGVAQNFTDALTSAAGLANLKTLIDNTKAGLDAFGPVIRTIMDTFLQMAAVGSQAFVPLSKMLGDVTAEFQTMMQTLIGNGTFQKALDGLVQVLGALGHGINELLNFAIQLGASLGGPLADALNAIFALIQPLTPLAESLGKVLLNLVTTIAQTLLPVLQQMTPAFENLVNTFGQLLIPIIQSLAQPLSQLVTGFMQLATALEPLYGPTSLTATAMQGLGTVMEGIAPLFDAIGGALGKVVEGLNSALMPVIPVVAQMLANLAQILAPLIEQLGAAVGTILEGLEPSLKILALAVSNMVSALGPLVKIIGEFIVQIAQGLSPILPMIATALSSLVDNFTAMIGPATTIAKSVLPVLADVIKVVGDVLGHLAPILPVILEGWLAWKAIEQVKDWVGTVVTAVEGFITAVKNLPATIDTALQKLVTFGNTTKGSAEAISTVGTASSAAAPKVEAVGKASQGASPQVEALNAAAKATAAQIEMLGTTMGNLAPVLEQLVTALEGLVASLQNAAPVVETLGTAAGAAAGNVETLGAAAGTAAPEIEALGGTSGTAAAEVTALGAAAEAAAAQGGGLLAWAGAATPEIAAVGVAADVTAGDLTALGAASSLSAAQGAGMAGWAATSAGDLTLLGAASGGAAAGVAGVGGAAGRATAEGAGLSGWLAGASGGLGATEGAASGAAVGVGGFGAVLGTLGPLALGAGAALAVLGGSILIEHNAVQQNTDALTQNLEAIYNGGQGSQEAAQKVKEHQKAIDQAKAALDRVNSISDVTIQSTEGMGQGAALAGEQYDDLKKALDAAKKNAQDYIDSLTPLQVAQAEVSRAQDHYNNMLAKNGPDSDSAARAAAQLTTAEEHAKTAAQEQADALNGVNGALERHIQDALGAAQTSASFAVTQDNLNSQIDEYKKSLNDSTLSADDHKKSLDNLVVSIADATKQAGDNAVAQAGNATQQQKTSLQVAAQRKEFEDLVTQLGGQTTPALDALAQQLGLSTDPAVNKTKDSVNIFGDALTGMAQGPLRGDAFPALDGLSTKVLPDASLALQGAMDSTGHLGTAFSNLAQGPTQQVLIPGLGQLHDVLSGQTNAALTGTTGMADNMGSAFVQVADNGITSVLIPGLGTLSGHLDGPTITSLLNSMKGAQSTQQAMDLLAGAVRNLPPGNDINIRANTDQATNSIDTLITSYGKVQYTGTSIIVNGRVIANAEGNLLTPGDFGVPETMAADVATVVRPGTLRLIGDNPVADEAFIPLNGSPRSHSILGEAAHRMGYGLMPMAEGGVLPQPSGWPTSFQPGISRTSGQFAAWQPPTETFPMQWQPGFLGSVAQAMVNIQNLAAAAASASTAGMVANGTNMAIVQQHAAAYGWNTGLEWTDLVNLVNRESGFRNTAQNPTSTAYGMFQFLDSTWAGYGPKTSDPNLQAAYGLQYIRNRYGDPIGAWNHEVSAGWYDEGGWLRPGMNFARNDTGHGEMVFPEDRLRQIIHQIWDNDDDDRWTRRFRHAFGGNREHHQRPPVVIPPLPPPPTPPQPTTSIPVTVSTPQGDLGTAFRAALSQFAPELSQAISAGAATQIVAAGTALLSNPQRMAALNTSIADALGQPVTDMATRVQDVISSALPTARAEGGTVDPTMGAAGTLKSAQSTVSSSSTVSHTTPVTIHPGAFQVNVSGNADSVTVSQLQRCLKDWNDELLHQVRGRR
jgi:phage-related protein